jgi:hypothetical protein
VIVQVPVKVVAEGRPEATPVDLKVAAPEKAKG